MSDGNSVWGDLETAGPYRAGFHAGLAHAAIAVADATGELLAQGVLTDTQRFFVVVRCALQIGRDPQDPPPEDPPPERPPMDRETLYDFFEGIGEAIERGDSEPEPQNVETFERFFKLRFEVNDLNGA